MLLKNRYKRQLSSLTVLLAAGLIPSFLHAADVLRVQHDHDPWGGCRGVLEINAEGIHYRPEGKAKHERSWNWIDIQTVDRKSKDRFTVLTYQDQKWLLGRDRPWDFTVLDQDSEGLNDDLFSLVLENSSRPLVNRTAREIEPQYEVPVKHLHTFGGCEGTLRFGKEWIVYETDHEEDQRSWRRDTEVVNIWSTGPFDLEIQVYEKEGEDLLKTRRFRFQLKKRLDEDYYALLRRQTLPPR